MLGIDTSSGYIYIIVTKKDESRGEGRDREERSSIFLAILAFLFLGGGGYSILLASRNHPTTRGKRERGPEIWGGEGAGGPKKKENIIAASRIIMKPKQNLRRGGKTYARVILTTIGVAAIS